MEFRGQVVIGPYIVDFLAAQVLLVVEVDGSAHLGRERADARRDRWLRDAGYRVLRVSADAFMGDLGAVVSAVRINLRSL
jgi:very-short-patch-repair endonuclease